jgi:hypothetical protein
MFTVRAKLPILMPCDMEPHDLSKINTTQILNDPYKGETLEVCRYGCNRLNGDELRTPLCMQLLVHFFVLARNQVFECWKTATDNG